MAHTAKSQIITDLETVPVVKTNQIEQGGRVRSAFGVIASTSFLVTTAAQTYPFVRIPARARLKDIRLSHAAMGNGAVSLTLYRVGSTTAIGSALLCVASLASARDVASVGVSAVGITDKGKDLATLFSTQITTAGATSDAEFDVVMAVATVSTGAATAMGVEIEYVLPE